MTDYKGIQGYSVQSLSSDPGTLADVVGQLWYNSDSGKFKYCAAAAAAWAAGTSLNTARTALGGAGTITAGLAYGGANVLAETEKFDGTTWTEVGDMTSGRNSFASAGTQTAAIAAAGRAAPINVDSC